jgi:hypothetical protein
MSQASRTKMLRGIASAVALCATLMVVAGSASADEYPPDAFVATTEPVYFEGHAAYWYGGFWYYRDGNRWSHYDREPPELYQRRVRTPPARHNYEPSAGHATGRAAARPAGKPGGHR